MNKEDIIKKGLALGLRQHPNSNVLWEIPTGFRPVPKYGTWDKGDFVTSVSFALFDSRGYDLMEFVFTTGWSDGSRSGSGSEYILDHLEPIEATETPAKVRREYPVDQHGNILDGEETL
jgi:hypothetical protein